MEIHRFEKLWFAASLVVIAAFIATIVYGAVGPGVAMVGDDGGTVDPASLGEHPQFGEPGVYRTGEDEYAAYVVARRFAFQPGTSEPIRVPAGATVTFHVASADVLHGFELAGTNVNAMAIPGQVARFEVTFRAPAEYGIVCNEFCGSGHHDMAGRLVVVPAEEYEGAMQPPAGDTDGGT
jgi:cytochrome c oxidase subunit 2